MLTSHKSYLGQLRTYKRLSPRDPVFLDFYRILAEVHVVARGIKKSNFEKKSNFTEKRNLEFFVLCYTSAHSAQALGQL